MSVTECQLVRGPRSARLFVDTDNRLVGQTTATWKITTDDPEDGPLEIYLAAQSAGSGFTDPLPSLWATYNIRGDSDTNLYLQELTLQQNSAKVTEWQVTGVYKPLSYNVRPSDATSNPFARPVKYWVESGSVTEIFPKAYLIGVRLPNGTLVDGIPHPIGGLKQLKKGDYTPIVSASNQDYDEPLVEQRNHFILVAQKNFATLDEIVDFHNKWDFTLNSTKFLGVEPMCARFDDIQASQLITENQYQYYIGTARISFSRFPFVHQVVNRSYKVWFQNASGTWLVKNAVDDNMKQVTEPVLLTEDGQQLPKRTVGNAIEYRTRELKDYNEMGIS